MYSWKKAFVFSCYLKDLDGTGILGAIKCPLSAESTGTLGSDNAAALHTAINQQRVKDGQGAVSHALPDGESEYVAADSRLWSIPRVGFLAVNRSLTGVECKDGEKRNALVATRKVGNKLTDFYLFAGDVKGVYSGSLGRMSFRLSETKDKDLWHLQIISY